MEITTWAVIISVLSTTVAMVTLFYRSKQERREGVISLKEEIERVARGMFVNAHEDARNGICSQVFFSRERGARLEEKVDAIRETVDTMREEMRHGFDKLNGHLK